MIVKPGIDLYSFLIPSPPVSRFNVELFVETSVETVVTNVSRLLSI